MNFVASYTPWLLVIVFGSCLCDDNMGPADITIERIEQCENPENYEVAMSIGMKKLNRSHAGFTGCLVLSEELGEKSALNVSVSKWGDGGWKPNALNFFQADACSVLNKNTNEPWTVVMQAAGRPDGNCPIPKGEYCINDLSMDLKGLFPNMLYGKFMVDSEFLFNGKPMSCVRTYINSDPPKPKPAAGPAAPAAPAGPG